MKLFFASHRANMMILLATLVLQLPLIIWLTVKNQSSFAINRNVWLKLDAPKTCI